MVSFFPQPLPDEHFFSVVARYHRLAANKNAGITRKQLGISPGAIKAQNIFNTTFHSALRSVADLVGIDALTLANQHSLFPLFRLSMPSKLTNVWINDWQKCKASSPFSGYWMNDRMLNFDKSWRYCPSCITADREHFGVSYWHVSHQIPMLEFCQTHHEKLVGICPSCERGYSTLNELRLPKEACDCVRSEVGIVEIDWGKWLIEVYQQLNSASNASFEQTTKQLHDYWPLPSNVQKTQPLLFDNILNEVETYISEPFLAKVFKFYQSKDGRYLGKKRPNFVRKTLLESDEQIRHPIYYLLLLWVGEMSDTPTHSEIP